MISGNLGNGILISGTASGSAPNHILNTYIGTDATGEASTAFMGNLQNGVSVVGASSTEIGQPGPSGSPNLGLNVISGNYGNGIEISGSQGAVVQNNFIGTDVTGLFSNSTLANALNGIYVNNSSGITIGGLLGASNRNIGSQNLISGNLKAGVRIEGGRGNQIQGNLIGTTSTGNSDIGNGADGIDIVNSPANLIGGVKAQNIITGNNGQGVLITGMYGSGQGTTVQGNIIGANTAASQTSGNAFNGISLVDTTYNTIGGTTPQSVNVITSNGFGSFARAQLNVAPRTNPNNPSSVYSYSYSSVAVGSVSSDISFQAVTSQVQYVVRTNGTTQTFDLGDELLLFKTDATGIDLNDVNTAPNQLDLSSIGLPNLPAGQQWHFSLLSGTFQSALRDDLLLTAYAVNQATGNPVPGGATAAYLLTTGIDSQGNPEITGEQRINLPTLTASRPSPLIAAVGQFLAGSSLDGFVLAQPGATGQTELAVYQASNLNNPTILDLHATNPVVNDVITSDINNNGLDDILVAETGSGSSTTGQVVVYFNSSTTSQLAFDKVAITTNLYGLTPTSIGTGTFDSSNPNLLDLVVVDQSQQKAIVLQGQVGPNGQPTGTFAPFPGQTTPTTYQLGVNASQVIVADLEGSGAQDIAILDQGSATVPGEITLLSGNGDGTFRIPTNYDVGPNPTGMTMQTLGGAHSS